MNYPEELREKWNECMYDERDIIQRFLEKQYDIRYGRQRDTWHFQPAVKMLSHYGNVEHVTDIMLDKDRFVIFILDDAREYECFDFAYGELSKVIEALPDVDEIVRRNALQDLYEMDNNLRLDLLLDESPFVYERGGNAVYLRGIPCEGKYDWEQLGVANGTDFLVKLRDHIHVEHLHSTKSYKKVMEFLDLQENLYYGFEAPNVVMFTLKGTDVEFDVFSLYRDSDHMYITGGGVENIDEQITLTEKEINVEYLEKIAAWIEESNKYKDVMDTYNGHNQELVRKINAAWKDEKYHNSFSEILLALLIRDHEEYEIMFGDIEDYSCDYAISNAHNIMEHVCDDLDLECILKFIRYE